MIPGNCHRVMRPAFALGKLLSFFIAGAWHLCGGAEHSSIVITEVVSSNQHGIEDEDGNRSDWIEVANVTTTETTVGQWSVSDGENVSRLPEGLMMPPGARLIFFASGKNRLSAGGPIHLNFKLKNKGGVLELRPPEGSANPDSENSGRIDYPPLEADIAWARIENTDRDREMGANTGRVSEAQGAPENWAYFAEPTPGLPNLGTGARAAGPPLPEVAFSQEGGLCDGPIEVSLSLEGDASKEAVIHFRLDAAEPTEADPVFEQPLTIETSTTLRARAFCPGRLPGPVSGRSFVFIEPRLRSLFSSNLPVVVVDTHGQFLDNAWRREYQPVYVMVFDTEAETGRATLGKALDFSGFGAMHVRGQTSASNFEKKQYAWEIRDAAGHNAEAGILGFAPATDWILHAPYSDKTLMRNVLAYDTARRIAGSQAGVRTRYVEVFANQNGGDVTAADYQGVYVLMERIERKADRVDIAELSPLSNDSSRLTGGYIFKQDKEIYENQTFSTQEYGLEFGIVEPKSPTPAQTAWLGEEVNAFEGTLVSRAFGDPEKGYAAYVDVDSFIDLHWMVEIFREIDAFRISSYYTKDRGRKIRALPVWDYNLSLGNASYNGGEYTSGWYAQAQAHPWFRAMFRDPALARRSWERYFELRRDDFSTESFMARIDAYAAVLAESQVRNFRRWPVLGGYVWPNPRGYERRSTHEAEVAWMKNWLTERLAWIDNQSLHPPRFSHVGGAVALSTQLTITLPDTIAREEGELFYTLDGTDPAAPPEEELTLLFDGTVAPVDVFVPTAFNGGSGLRAAEWTGLADPPNLKDWRRGKGGVGYDLQDRRYTPLIGTDVADAMPDKATSCYIRIPFNLDDPTALRRFSRVVLQMKFDDGFAAYLNGRFVASGNIGERIAWNATALGSVEDTMASDWQDFDVTRALRALRQGRNVLAIHGLNRDASSSDALWSARLVGMSVKGPGISASAKGYAGPIPLDAPATVRAAVRTKSRGWSPATSAAFLPGAVPATRESLAISAIHYHPAPPTPEEAASGRLADDDEFVELTNTGSMTIDLSAWRFSHGIDFVFHSIDPAEISLAPGERGVVVREARRFRERHRPEKSEVKVLGTYRGYLSDGGERLSLDDPDGNEAIRIDYQDRKPWPKAADGAGPCLRFDPATGADGQNNSENWHADEA
jgi:hypothetical protein